MHRNLGASFLQAYNADKARPTLACLHRVYKMTAGTRPHASNTGTGHNMTQQGGPVAACRPVADDDEIIVVAAPDPQVREGSAQGMRALAIVDAHNVGLP